ncbi:MAG: exodeoxyribonuclease V subunit alpha [Pseudomonadota bacterium]
MSDSAVHGLLQTLQHWREQEWIGPLDLAFARFTHTLVPPGDEGAPIILLAALVSHLEARGHTCLPLDELAARPAELLGWPSEAMQAWTLWNAQPPQALLSVWLAALKSSPVVDSSALAAGHEPLVLHGQWLYLRRYWRQERAVAAQVMARVSRQLPVDETAARTILRVLFDDAEQVPGAEPDWQRVACAVALRAGLSIITGGPGTGKTYTVARLLALLLRLADGAHPPRITLAAPTGKAAARLRQSIEQALVTLGPDLAQHIGSARTLHALLGVQPGTRRFRHDAAHPLELDVLVVDEASMVHLEMMSALLEALPPDTRLILLGDKDQLASVEAGAVLGDLCQKADRAAYDQDTLGYVERLTGQRLPAVAPSTRDPAASSALRSAQGDLFDQPSPVATEELPEVDHSAAPPALLRQTVMLRRSRRFGGPIGQLAMAVNAGDADRALAVLRSTATTSAGQSAAPLSLHLPATTEDVVRLATGAVDHGGGYRDYLQRLAHRPAGDDLDALNAWALQVLDAFDRFRVLCAVREGPWGVTGLNQAIEDALARQGLLRRGGEWYEGRPVMITRNDPSLGVFNGDVGLVLRWPSGTLERPPTLRVFFKDGGQLRSVPAGRLADVDTAFAMTVHKSQGSEFGHAVLALPDDSRGTITRELVYTGITRARQAFSLVAARADVFTAAIGRRTRRHSGLADALVQLSAEP